MQSFQSYKLGKSVQDISKERNLSPMTIESHLAHFVFTGEINIDEIVSKEKLKIIAVAIEENNGELALSPIKLKLGDDYSYGEIRAVMSYLKRMSEA